MVVMSYISIQERVKKEQNVSNEFHVIKKVLSSLSQGVALTVNFPEIIRAAEKKACGQKNTEGVSEIDESVGKSFISSSIPNFMELCQFKVRDLIFMN